MASNSELLVPVWNKAASCRTNGFYMNFFINIHYLTVSKPSGYSKDAVSEILDAFEKDKVSSTDGAAPGEGKVVKPHTLICLDTVPVCTAAWMDCHSLVSKGL